MNLQTRILIVQLISFQRVDRVPTTEEARQRADAWLKTWTCANNFKAQIGSVSDRAAMELVLFAAANRTCRPHGFDARNFKITLSYLIVENGEFWINDKGYSMDFDLADLPEVPPSNLG